MPHRDGLARAAAPRSGAFAVVYKAVDPEGKPLAVRTFSTESPLRREHYQLLGNYLKSHKLRSLIDFEYRDDAIRSAGDGKWYPMLLMEWVEGQTLFQWVRCKCRKGKTDSLVKGSRHWCALVAKLADARVAHGDLQHANILVTRAGRLKLVDYDGMAVPGLFGRRNLEVGLQPYQHRQRDATTLLSPDLDNFSALLLYVAPAPLAAQPQLWLTHVEQPHYDKLLFRNEDFLAPDQSLLRRDLRGSPDAEVRMLADRLFASAAGSMDAVPPLSEIVDGQVVPPVDAKQSRGRRNPRCNRLGSRLPRRRVVLEIVRGALSGQAIAVHNPGVLLVGRGEDCLLRLADDPRVSRHHLLLEIDPSRVRMRDLGSRNGTRLNGTRYGGRAACDGQREAEVRHGDLITLGHTTIRVQFEPGP